MRTIDNELAAALLPLLLLGACGSGDGPRSPSLEALETRRPAEVVRSRGHGRDEPPPGEQAGTGAWPEASGLVEMRQCGSVAQNRRFCFSRSDRCFYQGDPAGAWEWLFSRNPVAPERFSGCRAEHGRKILVGFSDAELVDAGFGREWGRLAGLGIAPADLAALERTGERLERFGLTFERFAGRPGAEIEEVWWNSELRLPVRARFASGGACVELELLELERTAREAELTPLDERFSAYPLVDRADVADYEEGKRL